MICLLTGYSTIDNKQAENLQKLIGKNTHKKLNTNFHFFFPLKTLVDLVKSNIIRFKRK